MNDPEGSQDYKSDIVGIISKSESIGQTFKSRRPSLNGVTVWLSVDPDQSTFQGNSFLHITLYQSPNYQLPIYSTSITISSSWDMSAIEISFPAQHDSPDKSYLLTLETTGIPVKVHGRLEDVYISGNTLIDGKETSSDFAFMIFYNYDVPSVLNDLLVLASNAVYIIPILASIFLPGWTILELSGLRQNYPVSIQAALSLGISLAFFPLLFLWGSILNLTFNKSIIIGILCILCGTIYVRSVFRYYKQKKARNLPPPSSFNPHEFFFKQETTITFTLLLIIVGAFFVRYSMVRDLATPPWVDSVHHAMITRLILESGGLPNTYSPFMTFDIHNYHVGFHTALVVFTWLSKLEIPDSMLLYGQVLNALAPLSVYLLTRIFTGKPWAGIFAAIITAFITPMPAYYTSWGRYPQLAGLLILPTTSVFISQLFNRGFYRPQLKSKILSLTLLGAITISGLFLVHYRVAAFTIFFLFALFITGLPIKKAHIFQYLPQFSKYCLLCVAMVIILISPWLIPTLNNVFVPKLNPVSTTDVKLFGDFSWRFLTAALGKQALIICGLGLVVSSIKMPRMASTIILWLIQLFFFSNLDALKLPGGGFITGTSVAIMLFIPISLLGGFFLSELFSSWDRVLVLQHKNIVRIVLIGVFVCVSIYGGIMGARNLIPIINPITILSRQADRDALEWITNNLPPQSTFLINSFAWGFGLYAGNDGGYWISPETGSLSIPPPALYGLGDLEYVTKINSISQTTANTSSTPKDIWELMIQKGIEYIYIGVRGGELSSQALQQSGLFKQLYNQGGAQIYQIVLIP